MPDGTWRRRMNHELHAFLEEPTIDIQARIGRLRWVGHIARMDQGQPVKLLFDRVQPDGGFGRKPGRQRARWADQVMRDLKKICNLRIWKVAAQDRERWKRLLATARAPGALC